MVEEMVLEMLLPYAEVGNNGVNVGTEDEQVENNAEDEEDANIIVSDKIVDDVEKVAVASES